MQCNERQFEAWKGKERNVKARHGMEIQGKDMEMLGKERLDMASKGKEWHGKIMERQGLGLGLGMARLGNARKGKACKEWKGMAWKERKGCKE
jgi:hypothetical protein